jgi:hypothetical protein
MTSVSEINHALFDYLISDTSGLPINPWLLSELNRITVCLAYPVWQTGDDLARSLAKLETGTIRHNIPETTRINLSYLRFVRDKAIHALDGRLHNLIVLGISCPDLLSMLARLRTRQIEEMALHDSPLFRMTDACYSSDFDSFSKDCIPAALITMRLARSPHKEWKAKEFGGTRGFLPDNAKPASPMYKGSFHEIAIALIKHKLKPVFIKNLTDISARDATTLYKTLHPNSPMKRGTAKMRLPNYYVMPKDYGARWRLSASCYASIVKQLEQSLPFPPHKAWLLLKSYQTYQKLCWPLLNGNELPCIEIDDAYSICNYVLSGQLVLKVCATCGTTHLHSLELETDPRHCPACAIRERYRHLRQASHRSAELRCLKASVI